MEIYKKDKKVRSKKLKARVDLTAMVSVSFLLIGFFMITTELGKPKAIELGSNERSCREFSGCYKTDENRILTLLLGDNDKMIVYSGLLAVPLELPKEIAYGKDGIRKELEKRNKIVHEYTAALGKPGIGVTVIIKPSNKSNYKNLVDVLDEIKIIGIKSYAIVNQFTPEESKLLATK
jgi:biopolymer transport protein ExbD